MSSPMRTTTILLLRYNAFSSFMSMLVPLLSLLSALPLVRSGDYDSLLALRPSIDPLNVLQWGEGDSNVCQWRGVRECLQGRVSKLVIERLNLSGTLDGKSLNQLDQLRVLSFKDNSLSGQIPELSGLKNLKALYLNTNRLSGEIPVNLSSMHHLKVIVLSGNRLSGQIPRSLIDLSHLYILHLQDNRLNGTIPPFDQKSLKFFNVSHNSLSGEIPATASLLTFNESSFFGNINLCGEQILQPCSNLVPSSSPAYPIVPNKDSSHHNRTNKLLKILVPALGVFSLLCIALIIIVICSKMTVKKTEMSTEVVERGGNNENEGRGKEGSFSWDREGEGLGSLVFLGPGDQLMSYSLEDLLKASAETLGRGTMGSTYKAVMESGYIVTVKRLKDARYPSMEEFRRHVEILGGLRHPNLVPLRAYFQAREERLLVYDYYTNGSLFSLVHGTRGSGSSKPLHWTSCLKIAEDLASGLAYIHQNPGLAHGNLKSTNVLLGPDFESCLTDYGLNPFKNPDSTEESSASSSSSLFYRAPESRDVRKGKPVTQESDVYSYGVLLLELLTGKMPFQDLVQQYGSDIPRWVKSVREEETDSGDEPADASEEKITALVNIAMRCVSVSPENRPAMREVLGTVREARADARASPNSSDHSPSRWSDTVQSLPRDEPLNI